MKKKSKALVHPSFPPQGEPMPAHLGSQSMMPDKGSDNYPMGPDPGDYQQ